MPDGRSDADRFVRRTHVLVAPAERLRDLDVVADAGQPIAGDDQLQPVAPFLERRRRTLVREGVIDAAARPPFLALLDEREARDVDAASCARAPASPMAPRRSGWQRGARRVLVEPLVESVRMAVRREPDRRLVDVSLGEVAHSPGVGSVEAVAHHPRERLFAAAFELDEGLRLLVQTERGGLPVVGRPEADRASMIPRACSSACSRSIVMSSETMEKASREVAIADEAGGDDKSPSSSQKAGRFTREAPSKRRVTIDGPDCTCSSLLLLCEGFRLAGGHV